MVGRRVEPAPALVVGRERPRRERALLGVESAARKATAAPAIRRATEPAARSLAPALEAEDQLGIARPPVARRPGSGPDAPRALEQLRPSASWPGSQAAQRRGHVVVGRRARRPAPRRRPRPWPCPPRRAVGPRTRRRRSRQTRPKAMRGTSTSKITWTNGCVDGERPPRRSAPAAGACAVARSSATWSARAAPGGTESSRRTPVRRRSARRRGRRRRGSCGTTRSSSAARRRSTDPSRPGIGYTRMWLLAYT